MVLFAFRNSTSEHAEDGIITTMNNIRNTLAQLESDISTLEGSWSATEADQYYTAARNFRQGAEEVSAILQRIEGKLAVSRVSVNELRASIRSGLEG